MTNCNSSLIVLSTGDDRHIVERFFLLRVLVLDVHVQITLIFFFKGRKVSFREQQFRNGANNGVKTVVQHDRQLFRNRAIPGLTVGKKRF